MNTEAGYNKMDIYKTVITLLLFFICICFNSYSQNDTLSLIRLSDADNRNRVTGIVFDSKNTAWINADGIIYKYEDGNIEEIKYDGKVRILTIAVDRNDKLWAATGKGLYVLDRDSFIEKCSFKSFSVCNNMQVTDDNSIHFTKSSSDPDGIYTYQDSTLTYIPGSYINDFTFDSKGNIIAATRSGLYLIRKSTNDNKIGNFYTRISYMTFSSCQYENDSTLWCICNKARKIFRYQNELWSEFQNFSDSLTYSYLNKEFIGDLIIGHSCPVVGNFRGDHLTVFSGNNSKTYILPKREGWFEIYTIVLDKNGTLYVGTNQGLMFGSLKETLPFPFENRWPDNPSFFLDSVVIKNLVKSDSLQKDRWECFNKFNSPIMSAYESVIRMPDVNLTYVNKESLDEEYSIAKIIGDYPKGAWFLSSGILYNVNGDRIKDFKNDQFYTALCKDKNESIWLASYYGIYEIVDSILVKRYSFPGKTPCYALSFNSTNKAVYATDEGIFLLDKDSLQILWSPGKSNKKICYVTELCVDNEDNIIACTSRGVLKFDKGPNGTYNPSDVKRLSFNVLMNCRCGNDGTLWFINYRTNQLLSYKNNKWSEYNFAPDKQITRGLNGEVYSSYSMSINNLNIVNGNPFFLTCNRDSIRWYDGQQWHTMYNNYSDKQGRQPVMAVDSSMNIYMGACSKGLMVYRADTARIDKKFDPEAIRLNYTSIGSQRFGIAFGQPVMYNGLVLCGICKKKKQIGCINGICLGLKNRFQAFNGFMLGLYNEERTNDINVQNLQTNGNGVLAGLFNNSVKMTGINVGLLNNINIKGITIGLENSGWCNGISASLVSSLGGHGISMAIINKDFEYTGILVGLVNNSYHFTPQCHDIDWGGNYGLLIGLYNNTYTSSGVQVGLLNSNGGRCLQIGLINTCGVGMQVGVININRGNKWYARILPLVNYSRPYSAKREDAKKRKRQQRGHNCM